MSERRSSWLLPALCCAFFLAFTAPAHAQETTRARLLTDLDAATFDEHFPTVALAQGLSGRAALACNVAADGASVCAVAEETPEGVGFGAAAVAMSRDWRFAPRLENGQPVASTLRVNVAFENEVPTRQVLQTTLYVDVRRGNAAVRSEALSEAEREYLSCNWGGGVCSWPSSASSSGYENTDYYPPAAREAGVEGRAVVACAVRANQRIDCLSEAEAPGDAEFGSHAVRLVSDIAARLSLPQGAVFRVSVDFGMHDGARPDRSSRWEQMASGADFVRAYPRNAIERRIDGRAVLVCEIRADRRLDCLAIHETPEGEGFGNAARAIATQFRISPEVFGSPGYTVGERFRRIIAFNIQ